jgi:hypothetical protein
VIAAAHLRRRPLSAGATASASRGAHAARAGRRRPHGRRAGPLWARQRAHPGRRGVGGARRRPVRSRPAGRRVGASIGLVFVAAAALGGVNPPLDAAVSTSRTHGSGGARSQCGRRCAPCSRRGAAALRRRLRPLQCGWRLRDRGRGAQRDRRPAARICAGGDVPLHARRGRRVGLAALPRTTHLPGRRGDDHRLGGSGCRGTGAGPGSGARRPMAVGRRVRAPAGPRAGRPDATAGTPVAAHHRRRSADPTAEVSAKTGRRIHVHGSNTYIGLSVSYDTLVVINHTDRASLTDSRGLPAGCPSRYAPGTCR